VGGFSLYLPSNPCNFEVLGLEKYIEHFGGDVRDFKQLNYVFRSFKPQVVFHLAAQSLVRRSYDEPKLTFDTNVGGTVNILECIRLNDFVETAVLITSDKCYKNVEWVWGYRENDPIGGDDPYSASKGCAEMAINSYCQSFFKGERAANVASTRAGNVIGGGDWANDRIVPDCARAWEKGHDVVIRNPGATRPWQYVLEPISGYLWLGVLLGTDQVESGGSFNFGPKADVIQSVAILINTFKEYWGQTQWEVKSDNSFKKESGFLKLSCDKALALLNWKAILSFEETVEFTALWYKHYFENRNGMFEFSKDQIHRYISLAKSRNMQWTMRK